MTDTHVKVDGIQVRYRDSGGAGPAVLMLHGIGGSLELWSSQFHETHRHLRMIALDLPGHGLSDFGDQPYSMKKFAALVWQFADTLQLDRVNLVGNSMGGAISLQMLAQQPARVSTVLLAAAASLGRDSPLPFRLMSLPGLGPLMTRAGPMAVKQQIHAIFAPSYTVPDSIRDTIVRNVMRPGAQKAFLATLRLMGGPRGQSKLLMEESLATLRSATTPILLLHGRQDRVIPVAHSEAAQPLNPKARLQIIDDCGHTPQLERPDAFNAALQTLLAAAR